MPPDSFFAGRSANGASPVLSQKFGNPPLPFGTGLPEQAAEELDVLANAEIRIEVLAEPLRHIGDAGTDGVAVGGDPPCRRRARITLPDWICRAPATMLSNDDLPTPSGPISPTMQPRGSASVTASRATASP